MTVLPVQPPASQSWTELARQTDYERSSPAAGGVAQVQFAPVPPDQYWLIEHILVQNTSTNNTQAGVYLDDATLPSNLIDGTYVGNRDVADYSSPILVESNRALIVEWTNCNAGDVATAYIQYRVFKLNTTY